MHMIYIYDVADLIFLIIEDGNNFLSHNILSNMFSIYLYNMINSANHIFPDLSKRFSFGMYQSAIDPFCHKGY